MTRRRTFEYRGQTISASRSRGKWYAWLNDKPLVDAGRWSSMRVAHYFAKGLVDRHPEKYLTKEQPCD